MRVNDPEQALPPFVNPSPWDEPAVLRRSRAALTRTFADPKGRVVIDDTSFPQHGQSSVGVPRQYWGALGKQAHCPCAVSRHSVAPQGHYPRAMRLARPDSGRNDAGRLDRAGVPAAARRRLSQGPIALELLDQVRGEGLPGPIVVADAGEGVSGPVRDGFGTAGPAFPRRGHRGDGRLHRRAAVDRGEGCPWGRPQSRPRLADDSPRPVRLKDWAGRTPRRKGTWRAGAPGKRGARFAGLRVGPASGWDSGQCVCAPPIGLLSEEQADGKLKSAFSNLPAGPSRIPAVRLWHSRLDFPTNGERSDKSVSSACGGQRCRDRGARSPVSSRARPSGVSPSRAEAWPRSLANST